MTVHRDAEPGVGTLVQVYRNLNRPGRTYSIRAKATGLVVAHVESVTLCEVRFRVREGGRQRTLLDRQRNVHAFAEGVVVEPDLLSLWAEVWQLGNYNPYTGRTFFDVRTGGPLLEAAAAHLGPAGLHYCAGAGPSGSVDDQRVSEQLPANVAGLIIREGCALGETRLHPVCAGGTPV